MSAFNILTVDTTCPNCGKKSQGQIQFKFGNTCQLKYRIGDTITWGGNDIGRPDLGKVKAYGIVESTLCPFCGSNNIPEEYDVFITDNVITGISPIERVLDYTDGNEEYVQLMH